MVKVYVCTVYKKTGDIINHSTMIARTEKQLKKGLERLSKINGFYYRGHSDILSQSTLNFDIVKKYYDFYFTKNTLCSTKDGWVWTAATKSHKYFDIDGMFEEV